MQNAALSSKGFFRKVRNRTGTFTFSIVMFQLSQITQLVKKYIQEMHPAFKFYKQAKALEQDLKRGICSYG